MEQQSTSASLIDLHLWEYSCILNYPGDQMKKDEVGSDIGVHGGRGEVHIGFWWGNMSERHHLKDLGVDWTIILKMILQNLVERA
jgi:hypothetical protein